jgi:hypothetical protein
MLTRHHILPREVQEHAAVIMAEAFTNARG